MSYTVVGTAFVQRYKMEGEDKWWHEVLDMHVSCNSPFNGAELNEDFHYTIAGYDWEDLPEKEGYYAVQYAATMQFYQSWEGEWDCDADIHWSKVTELSEDEVKRLLGGELTEENAQLFPGEESFTELLGESAKDIKPL